MQVRIFLDEELIGTAFLDASNSPMGVATGNFDPASTLASHGRPKSHLLHPGELTLRNSS